MLTGRTKLLKKTGRGMVERPQDSKRLPWSRNSSRDQGCRSIKSSSWTPTAL